MMKAITLWQPWASLVALGVKTIETRSWQTSHRGPLAIHAAAKKPVEDEKVGDWTVHEMVNGTWRMFLNDNEAKSLADESRPLPLGAVVATCTLVDCVRIWPDIPMQASWNEPWSQITAGVIGANGQRYLTLDTWPGFGSADGRYVGDQDPYGDFTPGRYGWLLADIVPLPEPVPAKGKQGLWEWKP
jgi:activating signal cointegrator 1